MASYPYYQPSTQKTNQKPIPAMPRGTGMPPAPRPKTNPQPQESSEGPGEGEFPVKPMMESPVYDSEIGKGEIQIHLNREDLLKGLIYSEILAPPKSRRTGR